VNANGAEARAGRGLAQIIDPAHDRATIS